MYSKKTPALLTVSDDLESYVAHDFVQKEFVLFRVEQMSIRGSIVSHLLLYKNNLVSSWTCLKFFWVSFEHGASIYSKHRLPEIITRENWGNVFT